MGYHQPEEQLACSRWARSGSPRGCSGLGDGLTTLPLRYQNSLWLRRNRVLPRSFQYLFFLSLLINDLMRETL